MMSSDYGGKNYRYSRTNCNKTSLEVSYDFKRKPADHHLSLHHRCHCHGKSLQGNSYPRSADPGTPIHFRKLRPFLVRRSVSPSGTGSLASFSETFTGRNLRMPDLTNPYRKTPARQDLQKLFLTLTSFYIHNTRRIYLWKTKL